jgi:hypothetical protein
MVVIVILEKRQAKSKNRSHFGATEVKAFPVNAKAMSPILNYSTTIIRYAAIISSLWQPPIIVYLESNFLAQRWLVFFALDIPSCVECSTFSIATLIV